MTTQNNYTVINASAGAGKTYTLVQRVLMICLGSPYNQEAVKHILALTFTNKAANEMKQRILDWLGKFVAEDYKQCAELISIETAFKEQGKSISIDELHNRAKSTLDYILHHYSNLNISTIDKFNSKLIRAFSNELGLAQNFNLDIQSEPYLIEAVDQMLHKIGNNHDEESKKISEAFLDLMEYNLDNDERTNISKTLYRSAKEFIKDIHYHQLDKNKNFDWKSYENLKTEIRQEIRNLHLDSKKIAQESLDLIKKNDLEIEDFSGGARNGIAYFFVEIQKFLKKERGSFPLPKDEEKARIVFEKGVSSKGKGKESNVENILPFLIKNRDIIINNHILIHKKEKTLNSLLPLRVNKDIQDELEKIETEKDLVLLSKFNILINKNLKDEPSAFIYEKVGTRYFHYFFDEFQDTSALQWQNFEPLLEHTIASEGTSLTLVGDPKQSIYRFRGGDSQLMLNILNSNIAQKEVLPYNYRSAKNIVDFNNELYQFIAKDLEKEHQNLFGEDGTQKYIDNAPNGRVRVNLIENENKEEFYTDVIDKMNEDIQNCLDNGFKFTDICILCRGNSEIFTYSQLLGNLQVTYNGEKTFIKTISERGLTLNLSKTIAALIQFLNWTISPKNKRFLVMLMYYLSQSQRITIEEFSAEMLEIININDLQETIRFIQNKYGINLSHSDLPRLNLYNFIEH